MSAPTELLDSLGCDLELEPGDIPTGLLLLVAASNGSGETVLRHGASLGLDRFQLKGLIFEAVDQHTGWPA